MIRPTVVAVLNSRRSLEELVQRGESPAAVATWSSAVVAGARAHGIPVIAEDELLTIAERRAIHSRADDLTRRICGDIVPVSGDYAEWCWWALEYPFHFALTNGARTLRLLEALGTMVPSMEAIVHDREGYLQGAATNLLAGALGLPSIGFPPHTAVRETLHQRLDGKTIPLARDTVRLQWRGKPMARDARPPLVMIHTNEIAQLVPHVITTGAPHFMLVEDARHPWPASYVGPQVDARALEAVEALVAPRWPTVAADAFLGWERSMLELLAVTYQPSLREERAWATAAYAAGGIRGFLGASTRFHEMRARVLACRDLDIPVIMVQHGLLAEREGGRGNRVQHFATHQLEWSRLAAEDIRRWGAGGTTHVIGWPQGSIDHAVAARAARRDVASAPTPATPRPWVIVTSSPLPDEPYAWGEQFLHDALLAVRDVDAEAPIRIKHHPFQEQPEIIRALCTGWGFADVEIVGGADPWTACQDARAMIAFKSTAVFCAAALDLPAVVYHPAGGDALFERFPGVPIARTLPELVDALRDPGAQGDWTAARAYARTDVNAGRRAVAALRAILGPSAPAPARPGARRRPGRRTERGRSSLRGPLR